MMTSALRLSLLAGLLVLSACTSLRPAGSSNVASFFDPDLDATFIKTSVIDLRAPSLLDRLADKFNTDPVSGLPATITMSTAAVCPSEATSCRTPRYYVAFSFDPMRRADPTDARLLIEGTWVYPSRYVHDADHTPSSTPSRTVFYELSGPEMAAFAHAPKNVQVEAMGQAFEITHRHRVATRTLLEQVPPDRMRAHTSMSQ